MARLGFYQPREIVLPAPPTPGYVPQIETVPGNVGGAFATTPAGVILHSTRSGQPYSEAQEYQATVNYVRDGAAGLGWNATVGPGTIALHMSARQWGHNAREHSPFYLAVEFSQAQRGGPVSDGQLRSFVWWFLNVARTAWPSLPATFPNHSDLAAGIRDGKSDIEPRGQHIVRDRILRLLT